jgi:hypothetical protein
MSIQARPNSDRSWESPCVFHDDFIGMHMDHMENQKMQKKCLCVFNVLCKTGMCGQVRDPRVVCLSVRLWKKNDPWLNDFRWCVRVGKSAKTAGLISRKCELSYIETPVTFGFWHTCGLVLFPIPCRHLNVDHEHLCPNIGYTSGILLQIHWSQRNRHCCDVTARSPNETVPRVWIFWGSMNEEMPCCRCAFWVDLSDLCLYMSILFYYLYRT